VTHGIYSTRLSVQPYFNTIKVLYVPILKLKLTPFALNDSYRKKLQKLPPSKSESKAIPLKIKLSYFEMIPFVKAYVGPRRSEGKLPENEDSNDDEEEGEPDATCDDMNANDSLASFPSGPPSNRPHSAQSSHTSTSVHNLNISICTQLSQLSTRGSYSNESQVKNNSIFRQKKNNNNNGWVQLINFSS
jgi:hypothetical protein